MTTESSETKITQTWRWISYDVWGNANDGYEVNQSFRTSDTYELPVESLTDRQLWDCLKAQGFFKSRVQFRCASIDQSHEDVIYFEYKGKPEGELRLEVIS